MTRRCRPGIDGLGLILVASIVLIGCSGSGGPSASSSEGPSAVGTALPTATLPATPSPSRTPTRAPTFVATGKMRAARLDAAAVRLRDGRVLIAGGSPSESPSNPILGSAEIYDPKTGQFTPTGALMLARSSATAVLLTDGRALIIGGYGCPPKDGACTLSNTVHGVGLTSTELYDPATGTFSTTGSMIVPRQSARAVVMADGRVLVVGWNRTVEVYEPTTGKFTRAGSLSADYVGWTATLLPSGRVLVTGNSYFIQAELFDPASGQSEAISMANIPDLKKMRSPATATLLGNDRVLVSVSGYLLTYDPATNLFTESGSISQPGEWIPNSATLLSDGEVLFAGGALETTNNSSEQISNWAGLFDPATGFRKIQTMVAARDSSSATLLADGSVLICGGVGSAANRTALSSAELLVP
jgi:hypothetical protein